MRLAIDARLEHTATQYVCLLSSQHLHFAHPPTQTLEHLNIFKELESAKRGTLLYKQVVILDLAGLGMKHASSDFTGPMRAVVDIDQV
jgi:hypothetical protein